MSRSKVSMILPLLLLLLLTWLAACTPNGSAVDSGVRGKVWIGPGPALPTPNDPEFSPFEAEIAIFSESDVDFSILIQSDANGEFEVNLEPGTYLIEPQSRAPMVPPYADEQLITVVAGEMIEIEIVYDNGVR